MPIIIADDHRLMRDGMRQFLTELSASSEIHEASTLAEAAQIAERLGTVRLIILDLMMPGMNALEGLRFLIQSHPKTHIVVLSGYASRENVSACMMAGAHGFIPKTVSGQVFTSALRLVLNGERYVPPDFVIPQNKASSTSIDISSRQLQRDFPLRLTPREQDVLGGVAEGMTNKDISAALGLKEITVKVHLRNIFSKIGARNRSQAVQIAAANGIDARWRVV